jgi:Protein of unknown function (DUF1214)
MMRGLRERKYLALLIALVVAALGLLRAGARFQTGIQCSGDPPDGSVDVYFGPKAPTGRESNWIQTIPRKGWNILFCLYGPLEPWFNKSWRPGEIEPQS